MQRIINNPDLVVEDMLKGFIRAHPDIVAPTNNPRVLKYKDAPIHNKVGIVTGGGSGHGVAKQLTATSSKKVLAECATTHILLTAVFVA